jgi:hypothetical protein
MTGPLHVPLKVLLTPELHERIRRAAALEQRSMAGFIRIAATARAQQLEAHSCQRPPDAAADDERVPDALGADGEEARRER